MSGCLYNVSFAEQILVRTEEFIFLFSADPPGAPQIEGYNNKQPLKAGSTVTLVCVSRGGNPLATVTWYRNGVRIDSSYTTVLNGSKNTYEFVASEEDNNAVYSCQAKNDLIVEPLKSEITTIVQCKWLMLRYEHV